MCVRQQLIGVLVLNFETGRVFTDEELHLLSAFADQAALALENARLFQGSERRRRAAEGLYEVGRLISESLDPREGRTSAQAPLSMPVRPGYPPATVEVTFKH